MVQFVNIQRSKFFNASLTQRCHVFHGQFIVGIDQYFTGFFVNISFAVNTTNQILNRYFQFSYTGFFQSTCMTRRNTTTGFYQYVAISVQDVKLGSLTAQTISDDFHHQLVVSNANLNLFEEGVQDLFRTHFQCT